MKKFIVHVERGGKISVMEVEVEVISGTEDPSVSWLPKDEYRARVVAPKSLYEKQNDGSLVPPIWYSHAFYQTSRQARQVAEKMVRSELERNLSKHDVAYTPKDLEDKLAEIKEILL
jgi:hypothetical protein